MIVNGNLNVMKGSDNCLFGYMVGGFRLGDNNNNGEKFVNFSNFHHLVVDITLLERTCDIR